LQLWLVRRLLNAFAAVRPTTGCYMYRGSTADEALTGTEVAERAAKCDLASASCGSCGTAAAGNIPPYRTCMHAAIAVMIVCVENLQH
jgi:hypothetical protein